MAEFIYKKCQAIDAHIISLKNAATIVQQEAGNFNMAHCCSCQKWSLTILHMRKTDAHSQHTCTTVVRTRAYEPIDNDDGLAIYNYIHKKMCSLAVVCRKANEDL